MTPNYRKYMTILVPMTWQDTADCDLPETMLGYWPLAVEDFVEWLDLNGREYGVIALRKCPSVVHLICTPDSANQIEKDYPYVTLVEKKTCSAQSRAR